MISKEELIGISKLINSKDQDNIVIALVILKRHFIQRETCDLDKKYIIMEYEKVRSRRYNLSYNAINLTQLILRIYTTEFLMSDLKKIIYSDDKPNFI